MMFDVSLLVPVSSATEFSANSCFIYLFTIHCHSETVLFEESGITVLLLKMRVIADQQTQR